MASAPVGFSDAAQDLLQISLAQREHGRERAIFADLESLWSEASTDHWAGRDGKALLPGSFWRARFLLEALLPLAPAPELTIDNDGEVEMDWLFSRDRMLSLSVAADGRLTYTFRDGQRAGTVTEYLDRGIPERLASEIAAVAGRRA